MDVSAIASTLPAPDRVAAATHSAKDVTSGTADTAAQRKKAAGQFEAILVRQMLSKSVGSMFGGDSVAGSVYGDMMTDALAQNLTAGPGLGLGRMIEQQLTPTNERHAAGSEAKTSLHP